MMRSKSQSVASFVIFSTFMISCLDAKVVKKAGAGIHSEAIPRYRVETFLSPVEFPVTMAFAPDGRLFYTEKNTGNVRIVEDGVLLPDPFVTVSVNSTGERGLLGIEFDPDYDINGYVYLFYTNPSPLDNRVVRYTDVGGFGTDPLVLLAVTDDSPFSSNHNGGNVHFGPDGKLYVTIGDNGSNPNNSQELDDPRGKILRINPDGSIPMDNPFYDDGKPGSGNDDRIFALGLRNSFDFDFHPITGELFATENGPTVDDEVNIILSGLNYGWPIVTGFGDNPLYEDPILVYTPTIAPTGLTFYTGDVLQGWENDLLFVDWNTGTLRRVVLSNVDHRSVEEEIEVVQLSFLNDVAIGPDGWIYMTRGPYSGTGVIYRLGPNR
ncbi:MAG: PQQ-dependent sugar dehydrogenase [Candidatus Glassbacteria bacterium]